jgi:hypothetical protein
MNVNAVLERKPTVALVDELAHTNAPQSRNRKRYEDVEHLLRAGINVITTVNVQHFESLYNIVEEATGVRVKERVPDEIIAKAYQIVNIDLPAEDLQKRLEAGKISQPRRRAGELPRYVVPAQRCDISEPLPGVQTKKDHAFPLRIGSVQDDAKLIESERPRACRRGFVVRALDRRRRIFGDHIILPRAFEQCLHRPQVMISGLRGYLG